MKPKPKKLEPQITAEEIGGLLFGIHSHIEHKDGTDDIIYYEADIIRLLVKLGFPKPKWGKSIDLSRFKKLKPNHK